MMYIHLRGRNVKQEKLCEAEDMMMEELGVDNERVRKQLRDAETMYSYPIGLRPKVKAEAQLRQVGGEHYKRMDVQPWDVIDYGPKEQAIGFYRYNALKYIMRAGEKDPFKQDIAKAHHYLEKLLETLE